MSIKKKASIIFFLSVALTALSVVFFYFLKSKYFDFTTKLFSENNTSVFIFHLILVVLLVLMVLSGNLYKKYNNKVTLEIIKSLFSSNTAFRFVISLICGILMIAYSVAYFIDNNSSLLIWQYPYILCSLLGGLYFIFLILPQSLNRFIKVFAAFPAIWLAFHLVTEFISVVNKAYTKSFFIEFLALIFAAFYFINEARSSLYNDSVFFLYPCFAYSLCAGISLLTWSLPSLILEYANYEMSISSILFYVIEICFAIYCFTRCFIITEQDF